MTEEFSLLRHLGVVIPNETAPPRQKVAGGCGTYRVMSPAKRPPSNQGATRTSASVRAVNDRGAPPAPLADFAGEVVVVQGKNNRPNVEYIIYNARVPSRHAINMQLAEAQKKRLKEQKSQCKSSCPGFFLHERDDDGARRRLLENLKKINMEQAQQKANEREAQRCHKIASEAAEMRKYMEESAPDFAKTIERKRVLREELRRMALESLERKKQQEAEKMCWYSEGGSFPWDNNVDRKSVQREQCLAILSENRVLAEKKRAEHRARRVMERAWCEVNDTGCSPNTNGESGRMQDMNAKPDATQRGVDDGASEGVAASLSRPVGSGCGPLFFPNEDNNSARREECRRVAEINKVAAQEAEKKRMEETANRIEIEKLASLEAERMGREEKEKHAADKRKKKQELFSAIARNSARNKKGKAEMNVSNGGREDFFLHAAHEKDEEIRCKRVQDFYKSAREEMIANQKAKLEAKKREKEEDRRLVQEAVTAANLLIEEKRRIAKKNKESYEASLRAQILSKTKGVTRSSPAARPGPEVRHLYRCPVTRELLPPQEFTVVRPRRSSFCF